MFLRSLIAIVLSVPATTAIIGSLLVLVPAHDSLLMSLLLLAFPAWVLVASAAFMAPRAAAAAAVLIAISGVGFSIIAAAKFAGLTAL